MEARCCGFSMGLERREQRVVGVASVVPPRHPYIRFLPHNGASIPPRQIIGVIELPAVIYAGRGDLAWCESRRHHSFGNQTGSKSSSFPSPTFPSCALPTCAQAAKEALNKNAEHTDVDPGYMAMEAVRPSPHRPSSALLSIIYLLVSARICR